MSSSEHRPHGREEVVDSLITAAERLFAQRGIDSVSVREIANEANVNPGLLHRHFDSKTALVTATFARTTEAALEQLEGVEDPGTAATLMFEFVLANPSFAKTLASVLLGSVEPSAVFPTSGALRRLHAILEEKGGPNFVNDFLTITTIGLGWIVFSPALQFFADADEDEIDDHVRQLTERIRSIADGQS